LLAPRLAQELVEPADLAIDGGGVLCGIDRALANPVRLLTPLGDQLLEAGDLCLEALVVGALLELCLEVVSP